MRQKILKVGSSAALTIPKKTLEKGGFKAGDEVDVEIVHKDKTIDVSIKPLVEVDKELMEWTKKFVDRYRPALKALAKK